MCRASQPGFQCQCRLFYFDIALMISVAPIRSPNLDTSVSLLSLVWFCSFFILAFCTQLTVIPHPFLQCLDPTSSLLGKLHPFLLSCIINLCVSFRADFKHQFFRGCVWITQVPLQVGFPCHILSTHFFSFAAVNIIVLDKCIAQSPTRQLLCQKVLFMGTRIMSVMPHSAHRIFPAYSAYPIAAQLNEGINLGGQMRITMLYQKFIFTLKMNLFVPYMLGVSSFSIIS